MTKFILKICTFWAFAGIAVAAEIQTIGFAELPGERAEISIGFDGTPELPKGFTINQPARIVLDFAGVDNGLDQKRFAVDVGTVDSAIVVAGGGRTRLIINLDSVTAYSTRVEGNTLVVDVGAGAADSASYASNPSSSSTSASTAPASNNTQAAVPSSAPVGGKAISAIDFRRGEKGEGRVIIGLTNPNVPVDIEEVGSGIRVRFVDTDLPSELRRKLDVIDFATPVSFLSTTTEGSDALVGVEISDEFDYLAYQADNEYVISVKPLTAAQVEEKKKAFAYTGERLSLNFQDIQVRSVLQLIADFTELNLVASDTVSGSITLRLENVPWDQALDIVLKTKGLDKRLIGNVLMVAPAAEIAERERQEIETQKQLEELAPLRTEYLRIRYANARELFLLFIGNGQGGQGQGGQGGGAGGQGFGGARGGFGGGQAGFGQQNSTGSILSARGQAIVDDRTNSIILTDTEEKIAMFKELVERIDIPVRQVMIEARIVIANNDFRKELGVRISGDAFDTSNGGNTGFGVTGTLEGDNNFVGTTPTDGLLPGNSIVDLGVFEAVGTLTTNIITSNFLLGLELSALESSGYAEIVSQPKVITGDQQRASIESGSQIPFQQESASGGTTTQFRDAVLRLDVTPMVTPDDKIIMDLELNQDSLSDITADGLPVIDVTQLETQVLVSDGETIVLGGIYTNNYVEGTTKVPLLGDIPFLGRLFRNDISTEEKQEILFFITPRIISTGEFLQQ